jgi:hypothetical protein
MPIYEDRKEILRSASYLDQTSLASLSQAQRKTSFRVLISNDHRFAVDYGYPWHG